MEGVGATTVNGFTGNINLTLSGLPAGVTTNFDPPPVLAATGLVQDSSFQLAATQTAAVGSSTVTVTGTSGSITHSATFSLTVTPVAPFAIHLSRGSLSLTPASSASVQVSLTAAAGVSPQLLVDTSSLPPNSGIEISPPQSILTLTNPVQFVVRPGALAQALQNFPLFVTASDSNSGNSSSALLPLTISRPSSIVNPTRSSYARTEQNPTGVVYDQTRKLIFVSVEILNEVAVFSSVDGHRVATISVPYPAGIDEAADGRAVYVVSPFFSYVTTIDPDLLEVVQRTSLPQTPGAIATGFQVATLANGRVMILRADDDVTAPPVYLWNPVSNTFTGLGLHVFLNFNQVLARSYDHSKVLIYGVSTSGATAYVYNLASAQLTGPSSVPGFALALSPDGSQIISVSLQDAQTTFYDDQFNVHGTISLGAFPLVGVLYSLDGSRAFVLGRDLVTQAQVVEVVDTQAFSLVGVVPSFDFGTSLPFSGLVNTAFAVDETNLLFGPFLQGMGYLDLSSPGFPDVPFSGGTQFNPTSLSLTSSTPTQLSGNFSSAWTYNLYFGAPPASPLTRKGTNVSIGANALNVAAPAGNQPGPANVTLTRSDGFFQVLPDAVSYGPKVLSVDANCGSTSGGDSITVTGYGFEPNTQLTIGGRAATDVQFHGAFSSPLQTLTATTPPGSPGDADVTVTTSRGSTTLSDGFQYLNSAQVYPTAGALDAIVYDQPRQRLYISNEDHNRVEVFDLHTRTYLSPIAVGPEPTMLALTPDGTRLGVMNSGDGTISVIAPGAAQVVATYPLFTPQDVQCGGRTLGLSPAAPHRMLVNLLCTDFLDSGNFHLIDLDTGSLGCAGVAGCASNGLDLQFNDGLASMASTPDGSKIFLAGDSHNDGQEVGLLNLTANTLTTGFTGEFQDAAASADGRIFAASLGIADAQLSRLAIMGYEPYADAVRSHSVFGEKLNASGSLLFMPQDFGVQIFDVHTGRLVRHIALADPIPLDSGAMALDETGTEMFLISDSGITIAQLVGAPLSLASVSPAAGPQGAALTLRGSGFQNGTTVKFGSSGASATFVDQSTLSVTLPALPPGPVRVTVTNPDAHAYSLDAAFTVQ